MVFEYELHVQVGIACRLISSEVVWKTEVVYAQLIVFVDFRKTTQHMFFVK